MDDRREVVVLTTEAETAVIPREASFAVTSYPSTAAALDRLADLNARAIPAVLVVDAAASSAPVPAVVLAASRRCPDVPVVIAADAATSGPGAHGAVSRPAGSPALLDSVTAALRAAAQRLRVRTTLDRLNIRLREAPAPGPADYRRLTLSGLYLGAILEQARDGIVVTDRAGVIAIWNSAATALFRPAAGPVVGRRIDEVIEGAAGARILHDIRTLTATGTRAAELALEADGRSRDLELSFSLVSDTEATGIGVSIIARDVTPDRALQRELRARADALAESHRHKDEFLAVLSHELRTPLNAVLGWAQILTAMGNPDARTRRGLEMISRNAQLQRRLVEDLLDYARISAGRMPLTPVYADVGDLVRSVVEALRPELELGGLVVSERYAANLQASVDPDRLRQVITNVVANAVKFTEPGGRVSIDVDQDGDRARITVTDTGRGIAAEFLPYVFDEFRQADPSTSRTESGLGIGMAIARRIVRLHHGDIVALSNGLDRGATFVIWLPLVGDGAGPIDPEPANAG